jgi:hypothetical protein
MSGIQAKLKICTGCQEPSYIYKSEGKSDKFCKSCWFKKEKPKAIAPISKKKKEEMDIYSKLRTGFLIINPYCQVKLPGCTIRATDVHHLYSGRDREKYYIKTTTWKSSCRTCHKIVHDVLSSDEAIALGLKLIDN